jgi:protocatechuate 3,4-dioxygenase beta subunit
MLQSTQAAAMACTSPAGLTPALTEGPYFKAGSPESASLIGNLPGMKLVLTGFVVDANCKPVAGVLLDFWQADSQGKYDNAGYILRGHQFSAADGSYRLETVVPGLYPGRTEHIHFKVQAKGGPVLVSQLFFPGVNQNQSDGIYNEKLLITVKSTSQTDMEATYNFIVATK